MSNSTKKWDEQVNKNYDTDKKKDSSNPPLLKGESGDFQKKEGGKHVEFHKKLMRNAWDENASKSEYNFVSHLFDESDSWNVDEFYLVGCRFVSRGVKWLLDTGAKELYNSTILEIGCGNGRMTRYLSTFFKHVTAIDISQKMVDLCQKNMRNFKNVSVSLCNGSNFKEFDDNSFDCVWTTGVLQHLTLLQIFINYIQEGIRVLKPEGHFLFQYQGAPGKVGREVSYDVTRSCAPTPQQLDEALKNYNIRIKNYSMDMDSVGKDIVIIVQKDMSARFGETGTNTFSSQDFLDRVWTSDIYCDIETKAQAKVLYEKKKKAGLWKKIEDLLVT